MEKYDFIIENEILIHKNNFTKEKFKSHKFKKQNMCNVYIYVKIVNKRYILVRVLKLKVKI